MGAADMLGFRLRDRSLPPPVMGKIIEAAFGRPLIRTRPSAGSRDGDDAVRGHARRARGPIGPGAAITITFSEPMVDVSSQDEAATTFPVALSALRVPAGSKCLRASRASVPGGGGVRRRNVVAARHVRNVHHRLRERDRDRGRQVDRAFGRRTRVTSNGVVTVAGTGTGLVR